MEEEKKWPNPWLGQLGITLADLGWGANDDIVVEVGGVATSGIQQPEGANPKWAKQYGTKTYQNDAFIVIKNRSRSPVVPSQPPQQ